MPVTIKKLAPKPLPDVPTEALKFACMLAASEIPSEDSLTFPLLASYKLDGIRSPITSGIAMSRKMLPLPNRHMQEWVSKYGEHLNGLDGEMIVGPPNLPTTFNTTTSGIMKASGTPEFTFYVFEHWGVHWWSAQARYERLKDAFSKLPSEVLAHAVLVEQRAISNLSELRAFYAEALELGYEGLILKDPFAPYKFGRSTLKAGHAMKWKEFIDYDCKIVEVKQGKTNTNEKTVDELGHAKRSTAKAGKVHIEEVGGFVVECIDPNSIYHGMQFNCGPGSFTQEELRNLWHIRFMLPGRVIRVKSQKLGGKTLPRFPSFYGWVDDMNTGSPE